jgi:hypothetical protein
MGPPERSDYCFNQAGEGRQLNNLAMIHYWSYITHAIRGLYLTIGLRLLYPKAVI